MRIKHLPFTPVVILLVCLVLSSCGGGDSSSSRTREVDIGDCPSPVSNISTNSRSYEFQQFTTSCINIYFETNNQDLHAVAGDLLNDIESSLEKINERLDVTPIDFMVNTDSTNTGTANGIYAVVSANNDVIASIDYNLASPGDLDYQLAYSSLKARRAQQQLSPSRLIDALITEGLAIRFATTLANRNDPPVIADSISDPDLLSSIQSQAQEEQNSTTFSVDEWFAGEGRLPEYAGHTVGYKTVVRYLEQKPGSTAHLAFGVNASQLSKYIVPINPEDTSEILKSSVSVRTPDMAVYLPPGSEQVPVEEINQQADNNPGMYILEGYTHHKKMALTFDDGPSPRYTQQILSVLDTYGIKATFFITGRNLELYPEIARTTHQAGHTIANHSYAHNHNADLTPRVRWEVSIERTNLLFEEHLGFQPRLFRPPYGEITDEQVEFIYQKGMQTIMWSIDTRDWYYSGNGGTEVISSAVNNHTHEESIVLMHDAIQMRQNTVDALDEIILHHLERGYEFVTVDQLIGVSPTR